MEKYPNGYIFGFRENPKNYFLCSSYINPTFPSDVKFKSDFVSIFFNFPIIRSGDNLEKHPKIDTLAHFTKKIPQLEPLRFTRCTKRQSYL